MLQELLFHFRASLSDLMMVHDGATRARAKRVFDTYNSPAVRSVKVFFGSNRPLDCPTTISV